MGEADETRLVAWANEMRTVHQRLRDALQVSRDALVEGTDPERAGRDLLLFCHGFCVALSGHHEGEDRELFPVLAREHPELTPTLAKLRQDHHLIEYLLTALRASLRGPATRAEIERHLDGIEAVMETHFRYEERQLLTVLADLELTAEIGEVFGPL
ncbi:hemerythrin domain-containing protein [Nocardioides sp. W7]|uniref:hemerythrin domain-containing protein n=1 Tax=Nocardioides sp. W7 TaxID=2931390 RepID=UPI001FD30D3C|nr:hemerythrin domain-containing protein [Nocardioides sp. W7]